jgi:hypothetical protein
LLGLQAHQRPHNRLQAEDLVLRITSIELAALDPLRVALLPQGEFSLRFGNLSARVIILVSLLGVGSAAAPPGLLSFAPAVCGPMGPPGAAIFCRLRHLHIVLVTPALVLPRLGALGGWLSGHGILLQHGRQPLEQASFIGIA